MTVILISRSRDTNKTNIDLVAKQYRAETGCQPVGYFGLRLPELYPSRRPIDVVHGADGALSFAILKVSYYPVPLALATIITIQFGLLKTKGEKAASAMTMKKLSHDKGERT